MVLEMLHPLFLPPLFVVPVRIDYMLAFNLSLTKSRRSSFVDATTVLCIEVGRGEANWKAIFNSSPGGLESVIFRTKVSASVGSEKVSTET